MTNNVRFTVKLYEFDGYSTREVCRFDRLTAEDAEKQEACFWHDYVDAKVAFMAPMYIPDVEIEVERTDGVNHNRNTGKWEYWDDFNAEAPVKTFDTLPQLAAWLENQENPENPENQA